MDNGSKVWLIDYEYSATTIPASNSATSGPSADCPTDQLDELVSAYYGRRLRHKTARSRLQGIVGKYGWTLWGCIPECTSTLDFDFWEWAMERYESAVAEFRGPDFPRLLADAQAPD